MKWPSLVAKNGKIFVLLRKMFGRIDSWYFIVFQKSGIDKILPCMKIDDYLFDPCGYSMNGILQNETADYGLVRKSRHN